MAEQTIIRKGTIADLDALDQLEETGFGPDRFHRAQLRYLLTRANASTFVLEQKGEVRGAAIVLWRKGSAAARLYSIVIAPTFQGHGFGASLLRTCEDAASRRGCTSMTLEVRADNERAIVFYRRHGYREVETVPGFYADGASAIRMVKDLESKGKAEVSLDIPYYTQTLGFTCGPACLLMAMKFFDPTLATDRALELRLWKEATTIFMTSGLGGCDAFGLALAALRRGYRARVVLSSDSTPFVRSVRKQEKKDVIRIVHDDMKREARELGVEEEYRSFTFEDIAQAMRDGAVPIVLTSTYRMHRYKAPHWVVVTGFDRRNVYFHDPYEKFYLSDRHMARHLRIPIPEFRRMRRYGKDVQKSVVFISRPEPGGDGHGHTWMLADGD